jgi:hypothetical protein
MLGKALGNMHSLNNYIDTHSNSLIDSNASPKVKIMEEGVRACSLAHNTLGVKGRAGAPRWGLR